MILLQTIGNWIAVACLVHGFAFGLMNTFILIVIHDLVENEQFPQAVFQLSFQFAIGNLLLNFVGGNYLCYMYNIFNLKTTFLC